MTNVQDDWFLTEIVTRFVDILRSMAASATNSWLQPILDWFYLAGWWGAFAAILILALLVTWFVPFTTVRIIAGWVVSLALTAALAATAVFKHMKAIQDKLKSKRR